MTAVSLHSPLVEKACTFFDVASASTPGFNEKSALHNLRDFTNIVETKSGLARDEKDRLIITQILLQTPGFEKARMEEYALKAFGRIALNARTVKDKLSQGTTDNMTSIMAIASACVVMERIMRKLSNSDDYAEGVKQAGGADHFRHYFIHQRVEYHSTQLDLSHHAPELVKYTRKLQQDILTSLETGGLAVAPLDSGPVIRFENVNLLADIIAKPSEDERPAPMAPTASRDFKAGR